MNKQIYFSGAICGALLLFTSIFYGCIQEETFSKATIETNPVTSVTEATASCGGIISADGGTNVTALGVCWSTSPNPTIENDTTIDAVGLGSFTSRIKGLSPSTTYFVRAYAVNKGGVAYGLHMTFTTKTFSITTTPIALSLVTTSSAIGGGCIVSDGDSSTLTVKARGVCWNTFPSPTIENSKTLDGVGGGRFTSKLDSLAVSTTYFVRAYATNGNGTIYGDEVTFTTQSGVVGLATTTASSITAYAATSGGAVSADGGAPVTARGVCWSTSSAPTTANNKTSDGNGTGTFTSSITDLSPATTYYVRSYATNNFGISYGNEVTFTTQSGVVSLITNAVSSIGVYTATCGGAITTDGGAAVTAHGVCWNTTASPTIADSKTTRGNGIGGFISTLIGLTANTTYYVRAYATNSVGTFYGNQVIFSSLPSSGVMTDVDGNSYNYITIGSQTWMVENLKTTKYNDGTPIPLVTDGTAWANLTTPGYCWYNNDVANKTTYGALYNWYTVNTGKLAPTGWHVSTEAEWTILGNFLIANGYNYDGTTTGNKMAKSLAAKTNWASSTTTGAIGNDLSKNNTSGFTGLPGGSRASSGPFDYIGSLGYWWCSTHGSSNNFAWFSFLNCNFEKRLSSEGNEQHGFSVRCVRD